MGHRPGPRERHTLSSFILSELTYARETKCITGSETVRDDMGRKGRRYPHLPLHPHIQWTLNESEKAGPSERRGQGVMLSEEPCCKLKWEKMCQRETFTFKCRRNQSVWRNPSVKEMKNKWKTNLHLYETERNMYLRLTDFFVFSRVWLSAELPLPDLPAHVELHALEAAQRVREEHGGGHRPCPQLQLRLLAGEHHERVLPPEELQPHSDRRTAGHKGLRHRHATGWVGWRWRGKEGD